MPIVTDEGIHTEELCVNSKRYLSRLLSERLLIGAQVKNSGFISWEELLRLKISQLEGIDLVKYIDNWLKKLHPQWDGKNKEHLKQIIINKLIHCECQNIEQKYLESRKQQAELHSKKLGLISIGIIISLAIGFSFVLPLLGTAATLVGVLCLAIGVTLICCSIIPAFVGERLIDPEWYTDYAAVEKALTQPIKEKIKGTCETVIIEAEVEAEPETSRPLIQRTSTPSNKSIINIFSSFFHHIVFRPRSNSNIELSNSAPNP
jgi:hypothetical protein